MKELVDIRTVKVDTSLPMEQRKNEYVNQIKDPFNFKIGKHDFSISFSNDGLSFKDCFAQIINS